MSKTQKQPISFLFYDQCQPACLSVLLCELYFFVKHLKVHATWSYFLKFSFLFHLKNHHSKCANLKFRKKQLSLDLVK